VCVCDSSQENIPSLVTKPI